MRWWRYGAFGLGFPPFFFFRFGPGRLGPWWSRTEYRRFLQDYLQDLERYKTELEEEIAAVKRELQELGE